MKDVILRELQSITDSVERIRASLDTELPPPGSHLVKAGESLQAALDIHDDITLEAGVTFEGQFFIRRSNSILRGNDSMIHGQSGPSLIIPTGLRGLRIKNLIAATNFNNAVILCGYNDSKQTSLDSVPTDIVFDNVRIPSHRGKRGFEINSHYTSLFNCQVTDLYDKGGRDSQAVAILNSPGDIHIEGGFYEAASENILVGGDRMKIPNTRPTNILIDNLEVSKPLAWKGNVPVKNLIELKDGHNVTIHNVKGRNCWRSGQDGYAFVFTPTLGASLQNVKVINCDVQNVSSIVQILGADIDKINTVRSQISFNGGLYRTNRAEMAGRGIFALVTGGPEYLDITNVDVVHTGNSFVYLGDGKPIDRVLILNSQWNAGQYGIIVNGHMQADNSLGLITEFSVKGNTINGSTAALRRNIPSNTFI